MWTLLARGSLMGEGAARLPLVQELGMHLSFRRDTGSWAQLATEGVLVADLCCAHGCYTPTQHQGDSSASRVGLL